MYVCQYCGTKYTVEEAKKMMIEGTVDVSGSTVKVDNSDELNNLYELARRAKQTDDFESALKYYDLILLKDPTSWEATFHSAYFKSINCKVAEIASALVSLMKSLNPTLMLVNEHLDSVEKQNEAISEITAGCFLIANLFNKSAQEHYNQIDSSIRYKYKEEMAINRIACHHLMYSLGDEIEKIFNNEEIKSKAATAWMSGIQLHYDLTRIMPNKTDAISQISSYANKVKKYNPEYESPLDKVKSTSTGASASAGGCYIATCVYGSYDCPQVWTLRRYRDYTLALTWYGRTFIRFYYSVSPTIVKLFGDKKWFQRIFKSRLDKMVEELNSQGYAETPYNDKEW